MKQSPKKSLAQLVTAEEVAEAWKCSVREIAEKARTREIPSYKIGRLVRFDPNELDRYLSGLHREARVLR